MPSRTRRLTGTGRCRCGPPWPASARWPASPPVRLMKTPPMYAAYPASASAASAHPEPRPSVTDTSGLPVDLRVLAKTGATTNSMQQQVTLSARYRPGIAVVLIGSNDTLLPAPINRCTRYFGHAVGQLRDAGWEVVVMPCADPGAAPGFRIGVRWLASPRARRHARRQSCIAQRFGPLIAPSSVDDFRTRTAELLTHDGVHPSPQGYAEHTGRVLPVPLEAAARLGRIPSPHERSHPPSRLTGAARSERSGWTSAHTCSHADAARAVVLRPEAADSRRCPCRGLLED